MQREPRLIIAAKNDVFDAIFRRMALIARLANGSPEKVEYEAENESINRQLMEVGRGLFPESFVSKHICVGDDWWPDHTQHVDVTIEAFTQAYYDGIRSILIGAPPGWRVQVIVYGDLLDGKTMVGSAAIWSDRALLDRALYGLVVWRQINLRCDSEPAWRDSAGVKPTVILEDPASR